MLACIDANQSHGSLLTSEMSTADTMSTAALVAPEDLRCGNFVAILSEIVELPSFLWLDWDRTHRGEPVRMRRIPLTSGLPWKVRAICLPFVFVESPYGKWETFDSRRAQLVRLKKSYAKTVWKKLSAERSGKNR